MSELCVEGTETFSRFPLSPSILIGFDARWAKKERRSSGKGREEGGCERNFEEYGKEQGSYYCYVCRD
jgi:hypothetical protein